MDIYLEKIEPDTNCFRFYTIRTEPDFFEDRALVVQWGRIGGRGRTMIRGSGNRRECEDLALRIVQLRLRHGYTMMQAGS